MCIRDSSEGMKIVAVTHLFPPSAITAAPGVLEPDAVMSAAALAGSGEAVGHAAKMSGSGMK